MVQSRVRNPRKLELDQGLLSKRIRVAQQADTTGIFYPQEDATIGLDKPSGDLHLASPGAIYFDVGNHDGFGNPRAFINSGGGLYATGAIIGELTGLGPGVSFFGSPRAMIHSDFTNTWIGTEPNGEIRFGVNGSYDATVRFDAAGNLFCGRGFPGVVGHYASIGFGMGRQGQGTPFIYSNGGGETILNADGPAIANRIGGVDKLSILGDRIQAGVRIGIGATPDIDTTLDVAEGNLQGKYLFSKTGDLWLSTKQAGQVYSLANQGHRVSKAFGGTGDFFVEGNSFLSGNLTVGGVIAKGGGSFLIDDPLDPANRDLEHGFVETDGYGLIYSFDVEVIGGEALIDLDEKFDWARPGMIEVLAQNLRVFTQNNETWDKVRGSVDGSTLLIESDNPQAKFTCQVLLTAERADPFVKAQAGTNDQGEMICSKPKSEATTEDYARLASTLNEVYTDGITDEEEELIEFQVDNLKGKKGFPRHPELYDIAPPMGSTKIVRKPAPEVIERKAEDAKIGQSDTWAAAWGELVASSLYHKTTAMAQDSDANAVLQAQMQVGVSFSLGMNPAIAQTDAEKRTTIQLTFTALLEATLKEGERQKDLALSTEDASWIKAWGERYDIETSAPFEQAR